MDYEKKYKEALAWMRELYPGLHGATKEDAEHYFPELRESEDERIRKWIREYIVNNIANKDFANKVLIWLEKQKEPQPYKGNADTMRKNLIKAFKSVGSGHWGGFDVRDIIYFLESKDAIELEKQSESKWNEEDEKMLGKCIDAASGYYSPEDKERMKEWLKSLKPQNHCEYNPYKESIKGILDMCARYDNMLTCDKQDFLDNVRVKCKDAIEYDNLHPQSHWKPTDEQMESLAKVNSMYYYAGLEKLYDELKKL